MIASFLNLVSQRMQGAGHLHHCALTDSITASLHIDFIDALTFGSAPGLLLLFPSVFKTTLSALKIAQLED